MRKAIASAREPEKPDADCINSTSTTIPATNALIWISFKPLLKLVSKLCWHAPGSAHRIIFNETSTDDNLRQAIPAAIGCCLTRAGLFPVPASRGASQLILNCMLPALLFSKIVPSITPENAKAIGPIFLVGSVYMLISMLLGVLVRMVFPTPRNFRWGLIAAATWSNWGDVPTSIAQVRLSLAQCSVEHNLTIISNRLSAARLPSPARRTPTWLSHTSPSLS